MEVRSNISVFPGGASGNSGDPAVVLVVGWVALGCHSEAGRYARIGGKLRCAPKSQGFMGAYLATLLVLRWCWWWAGWHWGATLKLGGMQGLEVS